MKRKQYSSDLQSQVAGRFTALDALKGIESGIFLLSDLSVRARCLLGDGSLETFSPRRWGLVRDFVAKYIEDAHCSRE